jgi:membrane-associated phospholipid phosphatase
MRSSAALSLLLVVATPHLARAAPSFEIEPRAMTRPAPDRPRLRLGPTAAALVAGSVLAQWGASAIKQQTDDVARCRWCEPAGFDRWVRDRLRWGDGQAAGDASDVLLLAVPLGSAAAVAWLAARDAGPRDAIEDLFVIAAAIAMTDPLTTGVKYGSARLRPEAWAAGGPRGERDVHSFLSGHTSLVFAAAAAATQMARLRGRSGWKWVGAVAFAAASATGWLRVGADQHWATDVLAGAAAGTAIGWAVPPLVLRAATRGSRGATLVPAPGGLGVIF